MEIIKVSYERIFPLAPYVNEKIGFEATIDGSVESEKEALAKLKLIAEESHKALNPELYQSNNQPIPPGPPPVITIERTSEDKRIADLIRDIYACTKIEGDDGLFSYRKMAASNKEAEGAYNIMYKKLNK
jgi:hypothetical protein